MARLWRVLAALVIALGSLQSEAHVQPTRRLQGHGDKHGHPNCSCIPGSRPAESYHIHVMFYGPDAPDVNPRDPAGNNPNNAAGAGALRTRFIEHFGIDECPPHQEGSRSGDLLTEIQAILTGLWLTGCWLKFGAGPTRRSCATFPWIRRRVASPFRRRSRS